MTQHARIAYMCYHKMSSPPSDQEWSGVGKTARKNWERLGRLLEVYQPNDETKMHRLVLGILKEEDDRA